MPGDPGAQEWLSGMRLAILSTHPIQYNAPLFRELSSRSGLELRVFYSWEGTAKADDPEFGRPIAWDVPLLDGYDWDMVPNIARDPGTHHYRGLDNPDMNRRVADWRPDALLVYGWAWRTHFRAMRHFKGRLRVLLRGDSTLLTGSSVAWKRILRRPALTWVYRHVDVALSPGLQNHAYLRMMGVAEHRIRQMPHAIDTERFSPQNTVYSRSADQIRRRIGMKDGETTFVYAGKLVARKSVDTLISAFQKVASINEATRLLIVGEGAERERLEAMAAEQPRITFLGFRNQMEMPSVYLAGDVFVLPSQNETWGLAVNEALALGRPVIASDRVGAAPDLLLGKTYGRIFPCGDPVALSTAMLEFVSRRQDLVELGIDARRDSASWSLPAAAEALLAVLYDISEGRDISAVRGAAQ